MTRRDSPAAVRVGALRGALAHPALLWGAFVAAHLWVSWLNLRDGEQPLGDVVRVYAGWMQQGLDGGGWVGVDRPWVYPLLAAVPMLLSRVAGPELVGETWLAVVLVLDLGAFAVLRRVAPDRPVAAWAWTVFVVVLGPIAVSRIDAVTVALALAGVLLVSARPALASTLLTLGAWTKVWPAALVVAALLAVRRRRRVLVAAVATTAVVVGASLALGSGWTVLGPVTEQGARGLQVESPLATLAVWRAALGVPGSTVYFDQQIITYQVTGDGVGTTARLATPLMALVVAGVVLVALRARRAAAGTAALLPPLSLALVAALVVTNKVGSPQFVAWFAVPLVLGLVLAGRDGTDARRVVLPSALVLAVAGLTQTFYPFGYDALVTLQPRAVVLLTLRNALEVVLLVVAVVQVWRTGDGAPQARGDSRQNSLPSGSASTTQVTPSSPS